MQNTPVEGKNLCGPHTKGKSIYIVLPFLLFCNVCSYDCPHSNKTCISH